MQKQKAMRGTNNNHGAVCATVETLAAEGRQPVIVWIPTNTKFLVYLCAKDDQAAARTLRAVASVGTTTEATGFSKSGATWVAYQAGAEFQQFKSQVPPHASATRIVLPSGKNIFAI